MAWLLATVYDYEGPSRRIIIMTSIVSWNINGWRAACKKGLLAWLDRVRPDILCIQELRAFRDQLGPDVDLFSEYTLYANSAQRPGYSGTGILTKVRPLQVSNGLGLGDEDPEGRVVTAFFPEFSVVNAYFPNGNRSADRLLYKLKFCEELLTHCRQLALRGVPVILCGDLNTAHSARDLANPLGNARRSGFLPEERSWIDQLLREGFVDSFRHFYPLKGGAFTWWAATHAARMRNHGWRFDYVFVANPLLGSIRRAFILSDAKCSDHVPVGIEIDGR